MLRTILTIVSCSLMYGLGYAQAKVGTNVLNIDPASILELESDSSGFLPSRLTSLQRDDQLSWDEGHIIYNTTANCLQIFDGSAWNCFIDSVAADSTIYTYDGTLTSERTVSLDGNQLSFLGTDTVTVTSDGRLGIGTSLPQASLEVKNGVVRFSEYGQGTQSDNSASYLIAADNDGDLVELNTAKNTRWFYPPPVVIDASATVTAATFDVHAAYFDQFTNSASFVKSPSAGSALPTYPEEELGYWVTNYDSTILANVSIDDDGILTYDIIDIPDDNYTLITIVFEIL